MSFILSLEFSEQVNESLQVGDMAYFVPPNVMAPGPLFQTASSTGIIELGEIVSILNPDLTDGITFSSMPPIVPVAIIEILDNLVIPPLPSTIPVPSLLPQIGDFIMFGKDKSVNTASLVGYYANVKFVNNSTKKVELFSVGSEVAESSK